MQNIETAATRFFGKQRSLATPLVLFVVLLVIAAIRGPHLFTSSGLAGALVGASPLVLATLAATSFLMTAVDPVLVTEVSVVFSAVALPLTYFPILVVANDPDYMGEHVNGRLANGLGSVYLVIIGVAAVAALPLMIWTRMGQ